MTSTFEVAPAPHVPEFGTEAPARPSSAVSALKQQREKLKKGLYLDLQVPRYEKPVEVFVRYGPIDNTRTEKSMERRAQSKVDEANLLTNADILVNSCIGVFACLDGDYDIKYSLHIDNEAGPWTKFDDDLAVVLDLPPANRTAAEVCRALYLTDGDLIRAANDLIEWSAKASEKLDTDFSTP